MRAAVVTGIGGRFVPMDVDIDAPTGREVVVDVRASGLCHSDLHVVEMGHNVTFPSVRGHEIAGVVMSGPLAGRTVGLDPAQPCGHCRECAAGLEHLCTQMPFAGHGKTDGGLRELMAWPDRRIHLLPDGYDAACGTLLEPLGVAVHSTDLAHLRHGWTVAVVGCGPIGLMLIRSFFEVEMLGPYFMASFVVYYGLFRLSPLPVFRRRGLAVPAEDQRHAVGRMPAPI